MKRYKIHPQNTSLVAALLTETQSHEETAKYFGCTSRTVYRFEAAYLSKRCQWFVKSDDKSGSDVSILSSNEPRQS